MKIYQNFYTNLPLCISTSKKKNKQKTNTINDGETYILTAFSCLVFGFVDSCVRYLLFHCIMEQLCYFKYCSFPRQTITYSFYQVVWNQTCFNSYINVLRLFTSCNSLLYQSITHSAIMDGTRGNWTPCYRVKYYYLINYLCLELLHVSMIYCYSNYINNIICFFSI